MNATDDETQPFGHEFLTHPGLHSEKVTATPIPSELFLGYTRSGYTLEDAVAEYVDNAIEQALKSGRPGAANISITSGFDGKEFVIRIADDTGGCAKDSCTRFLRPGSTSVQPTDMGISRFGIGGKASGLSVARRVVIQSWHHGDPGFVAVLDRDQVLKKPDWDFDIYNLPATGHVPVGHTWIDLAGVDSGAHTAVKNHFPFKFAERYALLLGPGAPKLSVGGHEIMPADPLREMLTAAEAPPSCGPRQFNGSEFYALQVGSQTQRKEVTFHVTVGLGPEISTKGESSAKIYCNGRLVGPGIDIDLGSSDDDPSRVHPSSIAASLRAVVDIRGPAELMPWNYRKNNLDPSAPAYKSVMKHLQKACLAFVDDNLAEQRRLLKGRLGERILPNVHDTIMHSYEAKLRARELDASKIRPLIGDSHAFRQAVLVAKSEKVPDAPSSKEKGITPLKGELRQDVYRQVKKLVESATGQEEPSGAFIVRTVVDHYIRCMGGKNQLGAGRELAGS